MNPILAVIILHNGDTIISISKPIKTIINEPITATIANPIKADSTTMIPSHAAATQTIF